MCVQCVCNVCAMCVQCVCNVCERVPARKGERLFVRLCAAAVAGFSAAQETCRSGLKAWLGGTELLPPPTGLCGSQTHGLPSLAVPFCLAIAAGAPQKQLRDAPRPLARRLHGPEAAQRRERPQRALARPLSLHQPQPLSLPLALPLPETSELSRGGCRLTAVSSAAMAASCSPSLRSATPLP